MNLADLLLLTLAVLGLVVGAAQGLIRQALTLLALYVALVLSAQYYPHVARYLGSLLGGHPAARSVIALVGMFVVLSLLLSWLIYFVYRQTALPTFLWGDRVFGAGLGLLGAWALAGLAVGILDFATSIPWQAWEPNRIALVSLVNSSRLVPLASSMLPRIGEILRPWLPMGLPAPFVL